MRLLILRHGATEGNAAHRYVGRRTDEPLSAEGRAQCKRFGARNDVRVAYASPLLRARQTARLCFPHARVVPVDGLAEFDFGVFEGRTAQQMEHDEAYRTWVDSGCEDRCPGGERLDGFERRTCEALRSVLLQASERGEELVVVVAHGGTVMAALHRLLEGDERRAHFYDWRVGNCEGYLMDVDVRDASVVLSHPKLVRKWG